MTRLSTILGSALILTSGSHAVTSTLNGAEAYTATSSKPLTTTSVNSSSSSSGIDSCTSLVSIVPNGVQLPLSDAYTKSVNYWSTGPAGEKPDCFVAPSTSAQVADILKLLIKNNTPFTVKGGGHTPYAGASSRNGGVIDVSKALNPASLAVVGGRIGDVGVPGLLLGGGISYFSSKYGFACDNVKEFEVVLPSGQVVVASADSYQDLFWALRGGGGQNFGIVTSFRLRTIKNTGLWSNRNYIAGDPLIEQTIKSFAAMPPALKADTDAHMYLSLADSPGIGTVITPSVFHAAPVEENKWPAIFAPFESIPGLFNQTVAGNISTINAPTTPDPGYYQQWNTFTVKATSADVLLDMYKVFGQFVNETRAQLDQAAMPTIFHTLTTKTLSLTARNGGNPLGLSATAGPLWIVQVNLQWKDGSKNEAAATIVQNAFTRFQDAAKARGVLQPFEYMNYAYKTQDVLAGYGSFNQAKLKMVSEKYAFGGAMKKLWTGCFQV
ncbi:hypothetical protein BROUX41_001648 [Berkeleyomyces rouxiae]|uniref:uncharacterized protein n=1 Tax=Berkeleyomyces rouxiae TaxID=2035830 RepID=UPI003B7F2651